MGSEASPNLPAIELRKEDLKPGTPSWLKTCSEVRQALEEYGCFIAEYREPPELREAVFGALKDLFDLPTQIKMKNDHEKLMPFYGDVGQIPEIPLHESLGIHNATKFEAVQNFSQLMWPNGNEHFSETVHGYVKLAAEMDTTVTRMIFESYGVEKLFDSYMESTTYLLRVLKNRAPEEEEHNLGFVTHTDKSFTTILHQNQVNGLEVDTKDGRKINVEFSSPSSFVVMAGDALMAWSNERIWSPTHRVIMNGKEDRYSMGLFSFNSGTIEAPQELIDEEHPLMYKPFNHIGLLYYYRTEEGLASKCPIKSYCGI